RFRYNRLPGRHLPAQKSLWPHEPQIAHRPVQRRQSRGRYPAAFAQSLADIRPVVLSTREIGTNTLPTRSQRYRFWALQQRFGRSWWCLAYILVVLVVGIGPIWPIGPTGLRFRDREVIFSAHPHPLPLSI